MLQLIPPPLHRLLYRVADNGRKIWWRIAKPPLEAVAVVAMDLNDQLLLIKLSYGSGGWNIPTGGINQGETPEQAAKRELMEETGCEAAVMTLLGTQEDQLHGTDNKVHVFSARVSGLPVADMREVIEAKFFPMHSLPEPLTKTTRRRLELFKAAQK